MNQNKTKFKFTFGQILMGVMVLVLAAGLVLNYLSLNEVSSQLADANKQYEKLVTQGEALTREIEQQVNFSNIDQLATERLGMIKLESYQIQYVDIVEADSMSATLANKSESDGLVDNIVRSFSILVEYLK